MNVYVVLAIEDYGVNQVVCMFSTREKAQAYLDSQKTNPHQPLYGWGEIEAYELDKVEQYP